MKNYELPLNVVLDEKIINKINQLQDVINNLDGLGFEDKYVNNINDQVETLMTQHYKDLLFQLESQIDMKTLLNILLEM